VRRTVVICVSLAALAVPTAALALYKSPGDGTLVVQNGNAPLGTPVVTLVIHGAAIGQITGSGRIVIKDPTPGDAYAPEVTGSTSSKRIGDAVQEWGAGGEVPLRFRAIGGSYKITIYGSGVDLVASGFGNVVLAGSPDLPSHDGTFSLNGKPPVSLPATASKPLAFGVPASTSTTG
jgi:hypothetical protein